MAVFSGNGAVGSPSFTFSSDTNTGMYRVDADKLGLVTNGANALTVDSSQNVGIGITSPTRCLHVVDTTTIPLLDGRVNTKTGFFQARRTDDTQGIKLSYDGAGSLIISNSNSASPPAERVYIDQTGTFRLGGTLPSAPVALISTGGQFAGVSVSVSNQNDVSGSFNGQLHTQFNVSQVTQSEARYWPIIELQQATTSFAIGKMTVYAGRGGANQMRASKELYFSVGYFTDGNVYASVAKSAEGIQIGFSSLQLSVVENGAGDRAIIRLQMQANTAAATPFIYVEMSYRTFGPAALVYDGTYTTT